MIPTRSQVSASTDRSWEINSIERANRSFRSRNRFRICAWVMTSSAVTGSSAITRSGRHASAIAIITRWRIPPESSCG